MTTEETVARVAALASRCRCIEGHPFNEWDGREETCPLLGNDQARQWAADVREALNDPPPPETNPWRPEADS